MDTNSKESKGLYQVFETIYLDVISEEAVELSC